MSDDDLLRPGAIRTVLDALDRGYSLLVVNSEVRSHDMSRLFEDRRVVVDADRQYGSDEMDRLFADAGVYLSFIGCVVIRRSIWLERDRESYYGSLFIHVGVIFQERLPGSALVIAAPLISIRYGNALWKSKEFEIWMFKWPSLLWSLRGVTDAARTIVCKAEPWRRTRILLFYRAKGTYSLTEYRRWIKPRTTSMRGRLSAALTALVPGSVANAIALFYCRFFHRGSGLVLRDVMNSRYYFGNWFNAKRRS